MTHPSIHARTQPEQDRLPDGRHRQGDHLSRARRALEPGRASVSLARPEGRRPHRVPDGKPAGVHGDLLGGAAQRALLHRDQPLSDRRTRSPTSSRIAAPSVVITTPKCAEQVKGLIKGAARRAAVLHGRRARARLPLLGQGSRRAADHADRGRGRRLRHAVFVGHHRPAQGHQEGIRRQSDRRAEPVPEDSLRRHVRHVVRQHLSVAGAALSRRSAALQHDGDHARRHLHHHGAFRRRGIPEAGREVQGHAVAAGADHVRAHAEAAGRGAHALRRLVAEGRDPRRRALPGRRQGEDDRMVGTDPDRILRRLRRQRRHGLDLAAMADPSRHRRPRRGRQGEDPRRERRGAAGRARSARSISPTRRCSPITTIPRRRRSAYNAQGLVDARRRRLSRRGRLSLSHRPQDPT